jgi:hypothetical protein
MDTKDRIRAGARKSADIQIQRKQERVEAYLKKPLLCEQCQSPIPYDRRRNRFCSRSCAISYNNKGCAHNYVDGRGSQKKCAICDAPTSNFKFCSRKCFVVDKRRKIEQRIRDGKYNLTWSGNSFLRDFLIRERGRKCEFCQRNEWMGKPVPLTVHHDDGDARNNLPTNLRLICWNCHGVTPNFGRKNKSTRKYRYRA